MESPPRVDYHKDMKPRISHDRADESIESKARWYQSLSLADRMDVFCSVTDLALAVQPALARAGRSRNSGDTGNKGCQKNVESAQERIRILRIA
jgi:hypothetical protein